MCDPSAILILPPDGKQWMCDRPFNSYAIPKNTRCFLTCNYGYEVVQGGFSINNEAVNNSLYTTILVFANHSFQKVNGHFIDADLTENGTDPIKLIRHACQNVSEPQNESYFKIKDKCYREIFLVPFKCQRIAVSGRDRTK